MLNWFRKGFQHEDTRQYPRLPAAWPIKCEPLTPSNGKRVSATRDVSAGGCSVVLPEKIPVGSRIRIQIHIPPIDRTVQAEGLVARCQPVSRGMGFDVGIRFDRIDPADRDQLRQTIEEISGPGQVPQKRTWWRSV